MPEEDKSVERGGDQSRTQVAVLDGAQLDEKGDVAPAADWSHG
jgi:hypothetical protein